MRSGKLVYGVGINDADYHVHRSINGKREWVCNYYKTWADMLQRCYSEAKHKRRPTYKDCEVFREWLTFSKFKEWMEYQDWDNKELDKDLIKAGNREYCPEYCVFIHSKVNSFTIDSGSVRGNSLIGTSWHKRDLVFQAYCNNSFVRRTREHLGYFTDEIQAHLVWKSRKRELAIQLANSEYVTDERVAQALINRYQGDGVYIDAVNNNIPVEEFLLNREQYLSKV